MWPDEPARQHSHRAGRSPANDARGERIDGGNIGDRQHEGEHQGSLRIQEVAAQHTDAGKCKPDDGRRSDSDPDAARSEGTDDN